LCYLLPILNAMCDLIDDGKEEKIAGNLILLPTRELAVQVETVLKNLLKALEPVYGKKITTCTISGGFAAEKQIRILEKKPKIIVATIGRLWDLLQNHKSEAIRDLAGINYLVLDEIDRIIDLGQMKELEGVLKFIENP
jgi:superfamily II DNA/RNA helicase